MTHTLSRRSTIVAMAALFALSTPARAQIGVPKAMLWKRWTKSAPRATVVLDNAPYAAFLKSFVTGSRDGVNRVAYARVTTAQKGGLKRWLKQMETVDVDVLTRSQQKAYWINLYNAATLDVVLDAWPVTSITRIDSPVLGLGPWGRKLLKVKGESLSLNDIEHRILRPIWRDVRIHYAVNCASLGCPSLMAVPFEAASLEAQLDSAARTFINAPRAFRSDGGALIASRIYYWYGVDWGGEAGVLRHARRFATGKTAVLLANAKQIDSYDYDWAINART